MIYIKEFIEWTLLNPVDFFTILFIQYAVLATVQDKLLKIKYVGKALFVLFIVQDWWMNILMTALFLDPPAKWNEVVTKRMERYKEIELDRDDNGLLYLRDAWRYYWGHGLCKLLSIFDKGHC